VERTVEGEWGAVRLDGEGSDGMDGALDREWSDGLDGALDIESSDGLDGASIAKDRAIYTFTVGHRKPTAPATGPHALTRGPWRVRQQQGAVAVKPGHSGLIHSSA